MEKAGGVEYQVRFGKACMACKFRPQCTQAKGGRTLTYSEHHPLVQQRRAEMLTEAFNCLMKLRPAIEGTISQLMRQGARQARYRGSQRVNLQMVFHAVAVNIRRLCHWWAMGKCPSWVSG